ncbi:MAG: T9SS type A sorting domain-containing protein [Flavobacteriales bacterium]|nr:T9SS type A sorting domain-containing protein [Flavobacteriales bacterium]
MKKTLTLFAFLPLTAAAQMLWPVDMGGSTQGGASPYYSPQNLTISIGDMVRWTNISGSHSANGSLSEFPSNPEGFSSGSPQSGSWSWQFTFTVPGIYNYHCTQDGHAATQFGQIIVLNNVGMAEVDDADQRISVYPVPATERLTIEANGIDLRAARIIDLDGATVQNLTVNATGRTDADISSLAAGKYFVLFTDVEGNVSTKPFAKQ